MKQEHIRAKKQREQNHWGKGVQDIFRIPKGDPNLTWLADFQGGADWEEMTIRETGAEI